MDAPIRIEKPAILEEIPTDRSSVVQASAGTGKTYTLEHLIVELVLEEGIAIPNILVVTFTERATAELVERVRAIFQRLVDRDESDDLDPGDPHWVIDGDGRRRLREALFSFDRAPIYTIHGFCRRILVEHAFANRRPFDQEVAGFDELFDEALHRALRRDFTDGRARSLVLETYLRGGSIDDLRSLIAEAITTDDRVEPTGDFDAFAASVDRFESRLHAFRPLLGDIRQCLERIDREGGLHGQWKSKGWNELEAIESAYGALDDGGLSSFLGTLAADAKDDAFAYLADHPFINNSHADQFRPEWVDRLEELADFSPDPPPLLLDEFVPLVERRLDELKAEEGVFTFDDMLEHVHGAVCGGDEPASEPNEALVETLREEYQFALVDEFQDTDRIQWEIFRELFYRTDGEHPCVLIGDPKQAIYGFRGADVRTYFDARDEVREADGSNVVDLPDNYRSSQELIDAYNRILGPDRPDGFFTDPNEYPEGVDCGGENETQLVDGSGRSVAPVVVTRLTTPEDEDLDAAGYRGGLARTWAREIRRLVDPPADRPHLRVGDPSDGACDPVDPGDIFVLTRTRGEGDLFAEHLRAVGVPYAFYKREGLFRTSEAVDWYKLLRAVDRPGDRSRRLKAWTTPFFDLDLARAADVEEAVGEQHALVARLNRWNELALEGRIGQLVQSVLDGTGLLRRRVFAEHGQRELTNYEHLAETFVDWAQSDDLALDGIASRLKRHIDGEATPDSREADLQRLETERESVQIMTMHKAKGLSAGIVFVMGGFKFNWDQPYRHYDENDERVLFFGSKAERDGAIVDYAREEAERLLYVAMTRAEGRLYLPWVTGGDNDGTLTRSNSRVGALLDRLDTVIDDPGDPPEGFDVRSAPADASPPRRGRAPRRQQPAPEREADRVADEIGPTAGGERDSSEFGRRRAGGRLFVESYSSVARWRRAGEEETDTSSEELDERAEPDDDLAPDPPEDPPPGRRTGLCLHMLLEDLDPAVVVAADDYEQWRAEPSVDDLLNSLPAHFGLENHRDALAGLAWRSMSTPILTTGVDLPPIAQVDRRRVEMEFWYPIPDADAAALPELLGAGRPVRTPNEDGYLRGFIDLLFEVDGRLYAADWKSNWLRGPRAYASESVREVVGDRYPVQARFYTTALARLIARSVDSQRAFDERFGGLIYLFSRGMRPPEEGEPTPGVFFERPDFDALCEWETWSGSELTEKIGSHRDSIAGGEYDRWS